MISRLTGKLIEKQPPQVVIDVQGVAYEVDVSMQTFYLLPALNETVQLFTQLIVREDAHLLFGFATQSERATFRQLIKVSGIGAKTALGILSAMNADELAQAVAQEDVKRLSSAPGIGKKTAERMILELRGKLATSDVATGLFAPADGNRDESDDIVSTLLALGYNEREARAAIKDIPAGVDVGEGVRLALKNMLK
ncbi:MAG: Holliday junction branch migration protein RuvA [Neisseria sp.]|nr:Holliday junction branch migration protein RuvA [Neisseria sp.]